MRLGELLVQSKVITAEQLAEALRTPRDPSKKLGQVLLERGWLTEAQLTQTLSLQLSVPWVSLYHIDFSRQLLNRVSRDVADRYCLIPIFVRHVKGQGETLYVAMDDPTNEAALTEVAHQANLPTKPMIASATDIRSAIRVYYGDPSAPSSLDAPTAREGKPRGEPPPSPPARPDEPHRASQPPPLPPRKPAQSVTARSESGRESAHDLEESGPPTARSNPPPGMAAVAVAEEARRRASLEGSAAAVRKRSKLVSLTLLDGTTIQLPSRPGGGSAKETFASKEGLTAGDFIKALRASAHGADASEVLGPHPQWEPVIAALLTILIRKGLIADWEFVEELRKM